MAKRGVVLAAATAGVVAAGVVVLLSLRPQWRKYAIEAGRHVLNLADHVLHRAVDEAQRLPRARGRLRG